MNFDQDSLKTLFEDIESTVGRESGSGSLNGAFSIYMAVANAKKSEDAADDDYFREMVGVIFRSGLPARLAKERIGAIDGRFTQYRLVAEFDNQYVTELLRDPAIAKHDRKIRRIIAIAKSFRTVISEYGSFQTYLNSLGGKDIESVLALRTSLMRRFAYLGKCTSLMFLVEVGYPILRPVRPVMRVLERLGLISASVANGGEDDHGPLNESQLIAVVKAGWRIADSTRKPVQYISEILTAFSQGLASPATGFGENALVAGICSEEKPSCHLCGVRDRCLYQNKTDFIGHEELMNSGVRIVPDTNRELQLRFN